MTHSLDEAMIIEEIRFLHESLASASSSNIGFIADDLQFLRDTFLRFDVRGTFADMQRVECAGYALWTTKEGAAEIQDGCQSYDFKQALEIQAVLESRLQAQDRQINKLKEDMERIAFHKKLNLDVPYDTPAPQKSPRLVEVESTKTEVSAPEVKEPVNVVKSEIEEESASPENAIATSSDKDDDKAAWMSPLDSASDDGFFKSEIEEESASPENEIATSSYEEGNKAACMSPLDSASDDGFFKSEIEEENAPPENEIATSSDKDGNKAACMSPSGSVSNDVFYDTQTANSTEEPLRTVPTDEAERAEEETEAEQDGEEGVEVIKCNTSEFIENNELASVLSLD
jgi:hypothetical protein